jgi:signal transduction histidine kinase
MSARPEIRFIVRLVELVAGVGFVLGTHPASSPRFGLGLAADTVGGGAWLLWILIGDDRRRSLYALIVWSVAGGVSATCHSTGVGTHYTGLVYVGASAAATAFSFGIPTSLGASVLPGLAAFFLTNVIWGITAGHLALVVGIGLGGLVFGVGERQLLERGRESTLLATAERRVALAEGEAELAAERNRLGRELHDVLAHTLGAASIQLTALDSRMAAGETLDELRARVRNLHGLIGDGLEEARDAVRALRDDRLSLETQIERLCRLHAASLRIIGHSRALRAEEALALYRVVQEALTNTAKHAVGAAVSVTLAYGEHSVSTEIVNGPAGARDHHLAAAGGGNGLDGMHARVQLAGGTCTAGPHESGWRVAATIPLS